MRGTPTVLGWAAGRDAGGWDAQRQFLLLQANYGRVTPCSCLRHTHTTPAAASRVFSKSSFMVGVYLPASSSWLARGSMVCGVNAAPGPAAPQTLPIDTTLPRLPGDLVLCV